MAITTKVICLIACHGGAAEHFGVFAQAFAEKECELRVMASGPAIKKFEEMHVEIFHRFEAEKSALTEIVQKCEGAQFVITDLGHPFDIDIQKALSTKTHCYAYYDNPESYVPGGYSETAAKVIALSEKVLFANANLVEELLYESPNLPLNLPKEKRQAIGFYPLSKAQTLRKQRVVSQAENRKNFLLHHKIEDRGQTILTYFGGNNAEYFEKAFPTFLKLLEEGIVSYNLSPFLIVLQQHPGAKSHNSDRLAIEKWASTFGASSNAPQIVISASSSDEMLTITDSALYYQTSMNALFALLGLSIIQVGHECYNDILIRQGLCPCATTTPSFLEALATLSPLRVSEESLHKSLGIDPNWKANLLELSIIGAQE